MTSTATGSAAIAFAVRALPPKKDGANSMWRKSAEVDRVIALSLAAAETLGDRPPLSGSVAVVLKVHVRTTNSRAIGET